MTECEKMKLSIYESSLDQKDIDDIMNLMDSYDEMVCEGVEELIESICKYGAKHYSEIDKKKKIEENDYKIKKLKDQYNKVLSAAERTKAAIKLKIMSLENQNYELKENK